MVGLKHLVQTMIDKSLLIATKAVRSGVGPYRENLLSGRKEARSQCLGSSTSERSYQINVTGFVQSLASTRPKARDKARARTTRFCGTLINVA